MKKEIILITKKDHIKLSYLQGTWEIYKVLLVIFVFFKLWLIYISPDFSNFPSTTQKILRHYTMPIYGITQQTRDFHPSRCYQVESNEPVIGFLL